MNAGLAVEMIGFNMNVIYSAVSNPQDCALHFTPSVIKEKNKYLPSHVSSAAL